MRVFFAKNKLVIFWVIAIVMLIPLLINFIAISNQNIIPIAVENDWIGFFGSYSGSLIGGAIGALIALYVAKTQVNQQKVNFERDLEFRIKQQEEDLNNQLNFWKQQQNDEAVKLERENHKNQIYFLLRFEMETIKIRNSCIKLAKQANTSVFIPAGTRYDAASRERKTNNLVWSHIDKIVDDKVKLQLQLLQELYDEMVDMIGKIIWHKKDQMDLLKVEIEELNNKERRSKTDEIHLKIHQTKIDELEADINYMISEKKYYWDTIYSGEYIKQAEAARKTVREEIIKSCKLNGMEVPLDPNGIK